MRQGRNVLGHRVRPALTHAASLGALQALPSSPARHPVSYAVGILVHNDIVLERAVTLRAGCGEKVHAHVPALAIGRSREVCVIRSGGVLDRRSDAVALFTAVVEVVLLEVERGLGEAVSVSDVVHGVDEVEVVHARSVNVRGRRGRLGCVLGIVEDEPRGRLRGDAGGGALVGDRIVAAA